MPCLGISSDDISKHGKWNEDVLSNVYLSQINQRVIRGLAGFSPDGRFYHLARSQVVPDEELATMVFPEIEDWESKIADGKLEVDYSRNNFLKLMKYLRVVFLQDSVFLREKFPNHVCWRAPIFATAAYMDFESQVKIAAIESSAAEPDDSIRRVAPVIASALTTAVGTMHTAMNLMEARINSNITANIAEPMSQTMAGLSRQCRSLQQFATSMRSIVEHAHNEFFVSDAPMDVANVETSTVANSSVDPPIQTVPSYKMNPLVTTLPDLWQEWTGGYLGGPAVKDLYSEYKVRWCPDEASRRFFKRRQAIIEYIIQKAQHMGREVPQIVGCLESYRLANAKSIDFISKNLKKLPEAEIFNLN